MAGEGSVVTTRVSAVRPLGGYDVVTLSVPAGPAWAGVRPGQFVVAPGDPATGTMSSKVHWVAGAGQDPVHGATVEVVHRVGHDWVQDREVELIPPYGRGFPVPAAPVPVLLVGHELHAAPLRWLLPTLRRRGCPVRVVLSAAEPDLHLDQAAWRRGAEDVRLTAPDQLAGVVAEVLDSDPETGAAVLVSVPLDLAVEVSRSALERGRTVRAGALDHDRPISCGTGLCGTCDLVIRPEEGRRLRPCLEGPVLPGEMLVSGGRTR